MELLLPDECLNNDILLAKSHDSWVNCQSKRASYNVIFLAIIILIVIVIVFYFDWDIKNYVLVGGLGLLALSAIGVYFVGWQADRDYKKLEMEQKALVQRDAKYAQWSEFVKYRREQQAEETQKRMADAQMAQGRAQQGIAVAQLGNTAMTAANFFKR